MAATLEPGDRPTPALFNQHLRTKIKVNWKDLGQELLNDDMVAIIAADNFHVTENCCRELISKWLDRTPAATWLMLHNKMFKIASLEDAAAHLKSLFQGSTSRKRTRENNASGSSKRSSGSTKHGIASEDFTDHSKSPENELKIRFADKEKQKKKFKLCKDDPNNKEYKVLIEVVNDIEYMTAICHMDGEYTSCKSKCELASTSEENVYVPYNLGKWGGVPVVVISTAKKDGAQYHGGSWYRTMKALKDFPSLKYVFGAGVCGGVKDSNIRLGDVVVSEKVIGYDHQKRKPNEVIPRGILADCRLSPMYECLSETPKKSGSFKVYFKGVLSGSVLVSDIIEQKKLLSVHGEECIAFEMEGAGILAACLYMGKKGFIVKGVSDFADEDKSDNWQPQAANNAMDYLSEMLQKFYAD